MNYEKAFNLLSFYVSILSACKQRDDAYSSAFEEAQHENGIAEFREDLIALAETGAFFSHEALAQYSDIEYALYNTKNDNADDLESKKDFDTDNLFTALCFVEEIIEDDRNLFNSPSNIPALVLCAIAPHADNAYSALTNDGVELMECWDMEVVPRIWTAISEPAVFSLVYQLNDDDWYNIVGQAIDSANLAGRPPLTA